MNMVRDYQNDNKKCGGTSSSNRLFKLENEHATEENCQEECSKDPNCVAVSGRMNRWCAGCKVGLTDSHQGIISFKKVTGMLPNYKIINKNLYPLIDS